MQNKIITSIAEYLGIPAQDIEKNALLREDLRLGPIELSDLINHLQKEFDITLDPEDTQHISTIDDLIVLVEDNSI